MVRPGKQVSEFLQSSAQVLRFGFRGNISSFSSCPKMQTTVALFVFLVVAIATIVAAGPMMDGGHMAYPGSEREARYWGYYPYYYGYWGR